MSAFPFHMAMAALAGASVAAFSSYYLHCRAIAQLLEFALTVERRRGGGETDSSSGGGGGGGRQLNPRKEKQRRGAAAAINGRRRRKVAGKRGSTEDGVNGLVDEKDGDVERKERGFSRIESLPGGTYESAHVLSDFSPY